MEPNGVLQFNFEAIGTKWRIDLYDPIEPAEAQALAAAVVERIEQFDKDYSRFRDDSLVTQMSRKAGAYELPLDAQPLLDLYERLYDLTGGAVTPLIGQTLSDAGYDAEYSLQPGEMTSPPAWDEVLDYRFPHLTLKQPALLDFGAAGKGYIVDIIDQLLADAGQSHYGVDAGGDLIYRNPEATPLEVGLEHPRDPERVIGVAHLLDQALCGSSGLRRAWAGFHHIINPHTLESPTDIIAVWATAKTALLADALTTALFFVEPAALADDFEFDYALVHADLSLEYSANFPARFF